MSKSNTVRAIYIGRRIIDDNGKLAHGFMIDGKQAFFGNVKWCVVGESYEANREGDKITLLTRPKKLDVAPPGDAQIKAWEALEACALTEHSKITAAKRFRREPRYLADFDKLQNICAKLNSFERGAFVRFLVEKLHERGNRK
jgi:hypothetical protein